MFKSIFAKYVTTFTALLLASFLLLFFIVNSVVSNDAIRAERRDMEGVSSALTGHLASLYATDGVGDFSSFIRTGTATAEDYVSRLLSAVMTNFEDMTVYVTDEHGGFIFSMGKTATHEPAQGALILPEDYFSALTALTSEPAASTRDVDLYEIPRKEPDEHAASGCYIESEFFREHGETLAYAAPVRTEEGICLGHVIVTTTAEGRTNLMDTTLRSVAVAGLWIMLAAIIAIYFITERVIGPLREMSRASKKLMVGHFDVRVHVYGKDEVAELATAFNQMASALESLDHMRNSFVANVSHDLRTPMTTISGFIDGILDGVIPPADHEHYLRVVSEEVRRLSRLVTALLDLSRLQAGDRKFDMKPFDICEMGRQILISFEQKIEARRLEVEFVCEEERMFVLADQDAIHQIFYNICDNAIKFSYDGGKLRLSFAWAGTGRNRKAVVKVYNEGQGIPTEDLPYIFERFYKSDKSRSQDKSGVGLGMFIAKTIIDAHKETISVASDYGQNCEFTFTLARTEPLAPRARGSAGGSTTGGTP